MHPPQDDTNTFQTDQRKLLEKIRRHALFLITRRDHTSLELKQKLSRKDYSETNIDTVISRLEETDLINPVRFAESYTHYRRSKGYGPRRIAMELQQKGVADGVIAEQVKITDNAWFTEIRQAWRKQFKGQLPTDQKQRARQFRFLYNRGFTQDQINSVFETDE